MEYPKHGLCTEPTSLISDNQSATTASPLSPRVQGWKELLAKLDPEPPPAAEPYAPPKAWVNSTIRQRKGRGRQ